MARTVKVSLEADTAKFTTGLEPAKKSTEDFAGKLSKLDRAIRTLPDVKITADTATADIELARIKRDLEELKHNAGTIDVKVAAEGIARMRAELAALAAGPGTSLATHINASQAIAELEKLGKLLPPVAAKVADQVSVSFTRRLLDGLGNGMKKLGSTIGDGLKSVDWKAVFTSMWTYVAIGAAVLGPAIGAAVTAGIGLAGIAGGIILAFHDPGIKAAAKDLLSTISSGLQNAAAPFVLPLLKGIGILKAGFQSALPQISQMFNALAGSVPALARGFSGFLSGLTSGLTDVAMRSKPLLDIFATRLPETGRVLGNMLKEIAGDSTRAREGMNMFFNILNNGLKLIGLLVQGLELVGQGMNWVVKNVSSFISLGYWKLDPAKPTTLLAKSLATVKDTLDGVNPALALTADQISKLTTQITTLTPTIDTMAAAMTDAVFKSMMGVDRAAIAVASSLTNMDKALLKGKDSLNINTAAGQKNRTMILDAVQANIQYYDAQINSGISAQDATRSYDANTRALEAQLRKAGLTAAQIDGLIGKYRNVPKNVNTLLAIQGLTDAINGLAELIRQVNGLDGRVVNTTIHTQYTSSGNPTGGTGNPRGAPLALGGTLIPAANGLAYGAGIYPASNPPLIKFAEPQTRGETLIPNYGIPAARGLALADYAASHYGGRVVAGDGASISLSIQPSGGHGMDAALANWFLSAIWNGSVRLVANGQPVTVNGRMTGGGW